MWSYLLAGVGILGLFIAARRPRLGWSISIAAQGLWLCYALATHQYGFIGASVAYTFVYARLLRAARAAVAPQAGFEPATSASVAPRSDPAELQGQETPIRVGC